jgi:hypothetical protein
MKDASSGEEDSGKESEPDDSRVDFSEEDDDPPN